MLSVIALVKITPKKFLEYALTISIDQLIKVLVILFDSSIIEFFKLKLFIRNFNYKRAFYFYKM